MASKLVQLPEVERLSPACIRILGGNPGKFTLQGTNTYLVGTGPKRLLVDTGEGKPSWIAAIKRTVEEEKASISSVLITHWHGDHTGGVVQLTDNWPDIKVYKNDPEPGQLEIVDGQTFTVKGASLTAIHTPGHTVDHMVLVLAEEDALFTGDNVLGQGTAVFEDLGVYMDSLEKMMGLFKGRAYPGHGPVISDGPGKIAEYIQHRKQREEQVVQTLRTENPAGGYAWTPMELVKVIYSDVPVDLHPAAAAGVLQILQKLQREGKVSVDGEKWTLTGRSVL
ncbi:metallo-beta-lactamase superfamily protein [Lasiosphaeria miniovina]|uniref:Metallo-beta-lactamase superfamily protein n=1 Tax=Lasiosphaeria miniovina TaxID=1954250 RepID=A0AA40ADD1_9PEZI|nr:metallo-beta-lactamase superfamily protein [Lasiosphaeria miniovina]KAK0713801.1 metallo-beta-lactamase superfamily protein [Lasiosphaeria miniovina]